MDTLKKQIVNKLEKYYFDYKPRMWKKFLADKREVSDDFPLFDDDVEYENVENLPSFKEQNTLILPAMKSDNNIFHDKFIETANNILLNIKHDTINIDLRNNDHGYPEVLVCSLLPIFYLSDRKILTYIINRDNYSKTDLVRYNNCIVSKINGTNACGTREVLTFIPKINLYINNRTRGAAEKLIIALQTVDEITEIRYIGESTYGDTAMNLYFPLSNGKILKIPYGYTADYRKEYYVNFCPDKN